jgi:SAM-dependent methyltransferase
MDARTVFPGGTCRFCGASHLRPFVNLGMSPPCESFLTAAQLDQVEPFYSLDVRICPSCLLVQLREYIPAEDIFSEYAYFSSYADSWLKHARRYAEDMITRFGLDEKSFVVELASNDGYLLRNFVAKGIPCLGVEPAANVAKVAIDNGVPTCVEFFGKALAARLAEEFGQADLIAGNNVLAQVPDFNDFVAGIKLLLAPGGIVTIEWPHVLELMRKNQFDTIYHEHYSYFSLFTHKRIWERHGMRVFDVERLATHGGSLRVFGCHADDSFKGESERLKSLRTQERAAKLDSLEGYADYTSRVERTKRKLMSFLIGARVKASESPATAHRGKAIRYSISAASAPISSTISSTAAPTSTVASRRARTFRFSRPISLRRHGRTTSSSCRGICAKRSPISSPTRDSGARNLLFRYRRLRS